MVLDYNCKSLCMCMHKYIYLDLYKEIEDVLAYIHIFLRCFL